MMNSPASKVTLPTSTGTLVSSRTNISEVEQNNSRLGERKYSSLVTSEICNEIRESNCTALTFPKLTSRPSPISDNHSVLLTKPKLLRKKNSEVKRYKELVFKKSIDCANAITGEQLALQREKELQRKLRELKAQRKVEMKVEKLRNKERLLSETERLRWQRDEARMIIDIKDVLIKKLRLRVKQLENEKEKKIQELNMKNTTSKNLLQKLAKKES